MILRNKIVTAVAAAAMATLLLAGCSSAPSEGVASVGEPKSSTNSDASSGNDSEKSTVSFPQCLRDKGLDIPDPGADGGFTIPAQKGISKEAVNQAIQECQKQVNPEGQSASPEQMGQAMQNLAKCMRENGFPSFKDPDPNGGMLDTTGIDTKDPKFGQAMQKCFGGGGN